MFIISCEYVWVRHGFRIRDGKGLGLNIYKNKMVFASAYFNHRVYHGFVLLSKYKGCHEYMGEVNQVINESYMI